MDDREELGIFEVKTHLSDIIRRVRAGERFYITLRGTRVAELKPVEEDRLPLSRGAARNPGYHMAADFDAPLDDLEDHT